MAANASGAEAPVEERVPLLSVGLLVYNGARHVERALDTLLAQEFRDFELIVSDNGSTDETSAICERYADRDPRVRYVRSPINRGAAWNFNHVVELARADLFVWAAHDDEWEPTFLSRCIVPLQGNSNVVCCYSFVQPIDDDGIPHGQITAAACDGTTRRERWNYALRNLQTNALVYGITRTAALRRTRGMGAFMCSDYVVVTELVLHGDVIVVPAPLHRKRMPRDAAWKSADQMLRGLGVSPGRRSWMRLFIRFQVLREMIAGLRHAKMPLEEERELVQVAKKHYWDSHGWRIDGRDSIVELLGPKRIEWLRRRLARSKRT